MVTSISSDPASPNFPSSDEPQEQVDLLKANLSNLRLFSGRKAEVSHDTLLNASDQMDLILKEKDETIRQLQEQVKRLEQEKATMSNIKASPEPQPSFEWTRKITYPSLTNGTLSKMNRTTEMVVWDRQCPWCNLRSLLYEDLIHHLERTDHEVYNCCSSFFQTLWDRRQHIGNTGCHKRS